MIEIEILLTFVYFLECTVVQCKEKKVITKLPISRSFSASKWWRDFLGRDVSGTTIF